MGSDIHTIAQIYGKNGDWDYVTECEEYKWFTVAANIGNEARNYNTYAVLADVRNGYGFAGVETGDKWDHLPILGLPVGMSHEVDVPPHRPYSHTDGIETRKWLGDHSHNHVLLSDLINFLDGISGNRKRCGVVDAETYEEYKKEGKAPDDYCGAVWGRNIVTVTPEQAESGKPFTHVKLTWDVDKRSCLGYVDKCVSELSDIANQWGAANNEVRMVFGFDS